MKAFHTLVVCALGLWSCDAKSDAQMRLAHESLRLACASASENAAAASEIRPGWMGSFSSWWRCTQPAVLEPAWRANTMRTWRPFEIYAASTANRCPYSIGP